MTRTLVALVALALAAPAAAQEWQVNRDQFAFAGTRLRIDVQADAPGSLQVIRGAPGSVRIAGRANEGFTAAGLSEREELTLTAAGAGRVAYVVAVPTDVWVEVRLPGQTLGHSIAGRHSRSFEWGQAPPAPEPAAEWLPPADDDPLFNTLSGDFAPAVIRVANLGSVGSMTVRLEGERFRVGASRPLAVEPGARDELEIRPDGPPLDLVFTLPAATRSFRLEAGGATALLVQGDAVSILCSPVTQQWLSRGRRWLTFNPVDGTLRCTPPLTPRHEG